MPINIQERFNSAPRVIQSLIIQQLNRADVGLKKYGCTLDRQDLSTEDWTKHAIEEVLDLAGYLQARLNSLSPDVFPPIERPNWENPETPPSNATEFTKLEFPELIISLFVQMEAAEIQKTVSTIQEKEPELFSLLANAVNNAQANYYLKHTNERPSPNFMLEMVGAVGKDNQRDLSFLKQGLEVATGKKIEFQEMPNTRKS